MDSVPFFDLRRQHEAIGSAVEAAVAKVLETQYFIGGEPVESLERRLADRVGVAEAIGVSSGTDALLVSLMALGIGGGDEVITTPFSFVSPVEGILRLGARPVFVDIDPETFNLDVDRLQETITEKTRAILPVHLYGQPCRMDAICEIADAHGLFVIEDMAQALDATHRGRPVGSFGDTGCVSFHPTKNLGGAGDGGMVFCDDPELAQKIRRLRNHGADPKYHHVEVGGNFRLDAVQAAVLGAKLDHLGEFNRKRREHAAFYDEAFADVGGVETPVIRDGCASVYNQYTVRIGDRDAVRAELADRNIGTNVYYPEPLHLQPIVERFGYGKGDFPEAEAACEEVLSLPVFPELRDDERRCVVEMISSLIRPFAPNPRTSR